MGPAHLRSAAVLAAAVFVAGCSPSPEPVPATPPGEAAGAAVVRRPIAEPKTARPVAPASAASGTAATSPNADARKPMPAIAVPENIQYVCVAETDGEWRQTAIEFAPKVAQFCRLHPEMGPCQYERNLCRRSGGRVYTTGGVEITMATEAEYDRKIMRVRFKSN